MKTIKVKSILLGLTATLLLSIIISSCIQQELPLPTEETAIETSALNLEPITIPLTQDNPIMITLKASEDIKHYNTEAGELLWDMATMVTYDSEETLPLIIIPIDNKTESETLSMFVAAYREVDNSFLSLINSIEINQETHIELGYTGTVEYKTVENVLAKSVNYTNGEVTKQQEFNAEYLESRAFNVYCFIHCANIFGVPSSCFTAYSNCRRWPSPYNGWCHSLAVCLASHGGPLAYCAYKCW